MLVLFLTKRWLDEEALTALNTPACEECEDAAQIY
jgi:hypothetical protein